MGKKEDRDKTPVSPPEFVEEDGQYSLFEIPPRREEEISPALYIHLDGDPESFPKREDLLREIVEYYSVWLTDKEGVPHLGETEEESEQIYSRLREIRDSWIEAEKDYLSPDLTEERKKEIVISVSEWYGNLILLHAYNTPKEGESGDIQENKFPPYRIVIDPETMKAKAVKDKVYLWGDKYLVPGEGILKILKERPSTPEELRRLSELRKLSSLPALGQVNISKDLVSSQFTSQGDILELGTEAERKKILGYQKKGKLLFGSLEGLSGGTAYFKSVSIALAKILNEQSLYFNPDRHKDKKGGLLQSGIPREYIRNIFGDSAKLEAGDKTPTIQGEVRSFPYILLSYERLAKELSKTGRISGGKDIEFIRLYINGGYKEFTTDPKTGNRVPVKSSYVPGLTSKKYPVSDGRGHFIFIPFLVNEGEIVDTTKKDPEVGCLLRLSPQFSKTLRGYTALRGDTIQLIGGAGRQRDITMDILSFLAFSRGTIPVLKKRKKEILSKYENKPTYSGRPGKLEAHFQEAIEKAISAKILLPGTDPDGVPLGYREEISTGGDKLCVFHFNPDYLKGEEILPETQSGGTE